MYTQPSFYGLRQSKSNSYNYFSWKIIFLLLILTFKICNLNIIEVKLDTIDYCK